MAKHTELKAEVRAKAGKGSARAIRREKKVPGVIYGDNKEPVLVSVVEKELDKASKSSGFFTSICNLIVDGKTHSVLPRDIQAHPVTDRAEHVDFMRVSDKTEITLHVPLNLVNNGSSCKGVSRGGVINIISHSLEVVCLANNIPEALDVDVKELDIGGSLRVSDVTLPKGVKILQDVEMTILTIVAPSTMKAEEPVAAAAAAAPAAGAAAPAKGAAAPAAAKGAAAPAKAAAAPAAAKKK